MEKALEAGSLRGSLFTPESERYMSCTIRVGEGTIVLNVTEEGVFSCYCLRDGSNDDIFVGAGTLRDGVVTREDSEELFLTMAGIEAEKEVSRGDRNH